MKTLFTTSYLHMEVLDTVCEEARGVWWRAMDVIVPGADIGIRFRDIYESESL